MDRRLSTRMANGSIEDSSLALLARSLELFSLEKLSSVAGFSVGMLATLSLRLVE